MNDIEHQPDAVVPLAVDVWAGDRRLTATNTVELQNPVFPIKRRLFPIKVKKRNIGNPYNFEKQIKLEKSHQISSKYNNIPTKSCCETIEKEAALTGSGDDSNQK